jgi:beta-lactamase regulating signal transducer with metallopeptidase domain/biopolymer transport protein ExbD
MIEWINEWSSAWAPYVAASAIQNTIFLATLFGILYLLRNASAQVKYMVGLVGLIKLLLPPFLPAPVLESSPLASGIFSFVPAGDVAAVSPASSDNNPLPTTGLTLFAGAFLIWSGSAIICIALSIASTLHLRSRLRHATRVTDTGFEPSHKKSLQIFRSEEIAIPLTLGLLPKRIFVPAAWDKWPHDCRQMIMRHEYAHIRRRDGLFQAVQIVAQALYFFHPLVWLLNRKINEYREMACDDASVANETASRTEYSRVLLEIAETIARDSFTYKAASALIRRKNELFTRVHYQLKEGVMRRYSKRKLAAIGFTLAAITFLFSWYPGGATGEEHSLQAIAAKSGTSSSTRFVDVSIDKGKGIRLDGKKMSLENFESQITEISLADKDNTVINLDCSSDTPMGMLFKVQEILQKVDLTKVSYKSDIAKALPLALPSEKIRLRIQDIPASDIASVIIDESGTVQINGKKTPIAKIRGDIERLTAQNERLIVSLEVAAEASYEDFVRVLDKTKEGGAQRILIKNAK